MDRTYEIKQTWSIVQNVSKGFCLLNFAREKAFNTIGEVEKTFTNSNFPISDVVLAIVARVLKNLGKTLECDVKFVLE